MEFLDPSPHLIPKYQESLPIPLTIGDGEEQRIFYVHEALLRATSEYFTTALSSNFPEGQQKTCSFPEDDPYAFRAYVEYLYRGEYHVRTVWPSAEGGEQQSWFLLHAQCFALGNKLIALGFKKYIVCRLAFVLENTALKSALSPTMETILLMAKTVYDSTVPKDGWDMRDLLAAYCASRLSPSKDHDDKGRSTHWEPTDIRSLAESQLEEFVGDVMIKVRLCSSFKAVDFIKLHFKMASSTASKSQTSIVP